jgi:hypothetical protein
LLLWVDRVQRYLNNSTLYKETVLSALVVTPPPGPPPASAASTAADAAAAEPVGAGASERSLQRRYKAVHVQNAACKEWFVPGAGDEGCSACVQRPVQSWQQLGGQVLAGGAIDVRRPMLCCRRLPGVVRRDGCSRLSLVEGFSLGGMGPLMCDRLLPELAYKLGRAHKYGA